MAAPPVVAALAVARESAAEIAAREAGHALRKAELFHRALEGIHGLAQFRKEVGMRSQEDITGVIGAVVGLAGMQIVTADLDEKDLAFHAKTAVGGRCAAGSDQTRHHLKLRTQRGGKSGAAGFGRGDLGGKRHRPITAGGRRGNGAVDRC